MTKPRKQTYTMDLFLKNIKEQDIRQDQDVQRLSDQWSNSMTNELIATVLNDGYIPPIILAQELNSQKWVVDGLQRSSSFMKFKYGNYRISSAVEEPIITYQTKVKDSEGEIMIDGNGDFIWESRQFDIRHKCYSQLPEELKKVTERKNGTLERIVMESVMCMFHLDNWKKSNQLGEYINENAAVEEFDILENLIYRLEYIITEQHYSIFNSRDSFIWFTLFYKFSKMGCDDGKFVEFLDYFNEETQNIDMEDFYGIKRENSSNKDKSVIIKKLDKLETMMYEFLGIVKIELGDKKSDILEFVKEHVTSFATLEDIEQYAEVLQTFAQKIGHTSSLWKDNNIPSLITIVAWSFEHDIDLDNWFVDYCSRTDSYLDDQFMNFETMRKDLEQFIKSADVA